MRVLNPEAIPTREAIQEVWLDRVHVDYTLDDNDMDVIRALCEIAQPTLTVERIYELIDDEMNDLVREALWNVVRHRAAIGEAYPVAAAHYRWLRRQGYPHSSITAEMIRDATDAPIYVARELLAQVGDSEATANGNAVGEIPTRGCAGTEEVQRAAMDGGCA